MNSFAKEMFEAFYQKQILLDSEVNFVHCKKPTTTTLYMLIGVHDQRNAYFLPTGLVVVPGSKSIELALYKASEQDMESTHKSFSMQDSYPRVWFSILSMAIEGLIAATIVNKFEDLRTYETNPALKHYLMRVYSDVCYQSEKRMISAAVSLNSFFDDLRDPTRILSERESASLIQALPIISLVMEVATQWSHRYDDISDACSKAWEFTSQNKQQWMDDAGISDVMDKSELARPALALVEVVEMLRPDKFFQEIDELNEKLATQSQVDNRGQNYYDNPINVLKELSESGPKDSGKPNTSEQMDLLSSWPVTTGSSTIH